MSAAAGKSSKVRTRNGPSDSCIKGALVISQGQFWCQDNFKKEGQKQNHSWQCFGNVVKKDQEMGSKWWSKRSQEEAPLGFVF